MVDNAKSRTLSCLCLYVGFNISFSLTFPILIAPNGPFHGILETANAKELATIPKISGSFSPSKDTQLTITCTSFLKSFGNKGRTALSIILEVKMASSDGLDSLFKNLEPKILPAA